MRAGAHFCRQEDAMRTPHPPRVWLAVVLCVTAATGCGGDELPPSLPRTTVYNRFAPRAELVDLAISNRAKAAKVRALYLEMETVFDQLAASAARELQPMARPDQGPLTNEQIKGFFAHIRDEEAKAWKRYVAIQMELRSLLSRSEFARLDKVR
jgi:predicted component of type VI protein secretion system